MMKHTILLFLLLCIRQGLHAQLTPEFPDGIYLSVEQLKSKTPEFAAKLKITKRTPGDVFWGGGNDFKLESENDSIKPRYIRNKIFAYATNDSIFLNCERNELQRMFALCITRGNFLAFRAGMSSQDAVGYGAIGGALLSASLANVRYLYVLSLRTGNARKLDGDYIAGRLEENAGLLAQFEAEKEKESEDVLIRYVNLLNGFILPNSQVPFDSSEVKQKKKRK
jgi:hypothetical protein